MMVGVRRSIQRADNFLPAGTVTTKQIKVQSRTVNPGTVPTRPARR